MIFDSLILSFPQILHNVCADTLAEVLRFFQDILPFSRPARIMEVSDFSENALQLFKIANLGNGTFNITGANNLLLSLKSSSQAGSLERISRLFGFRQCENNRGWRRRTRF